jgi:hypothetical protein
LPHKAIKYQKGPENSQKPSNSQKTSPNFLIYLGNITSQRGEKMLTNEIIENGPQMVRKRVSKNKKNYIGKKSLPHRVEVHRMKRLSIMAIILLTMTMFSTMLILAPEESEASPLTVVTLKLQEVPPKVDVSPGSSGITTFQGEIRCIKYGPDQVKAYLQASSDTGGANVNPPSRVFSGASGSEEVDTFSLTTRVPMGYTFMATPQVVVSGYFVQGGLTYEIPAVTQFIEIEPYYKLQVDTPPPQEIGAGEFVFFSIRITNVGNVEDTYRFEFMNLEDLVDKQWTVPTITDKTFYEKEMRTIEVSAQAPQTWTIWRNEVISFNLRITSIQSEETAFLVRYDVPLYVRQKGIYIPGFSPVFAILGIGVVALIMGKRRLG